MRKSIFLTTAIQTKDRLDPDYFIISDGTGDYSATYGISPAEAGIKYVLSCGRIDEIIVLGSPSFAGSSEYPSAGICDVPIKGISDLNHMSEYGFLCYRIASFMNQVDLEILDIDEQVSIDSVIRLKALINEFRTSHCSNIKSSELFAALCRNKDLWKTFSSEVLSSCSKEEGKWIRHRLFAGTDSYNKMHAKNINRSTRIRFVPVETSGIMSIETVSGIVKNVLEDESLADAGVDIYMDMQGIGINNANSLISTFLVMNKKTGYGCKLKSILRTVKDPDDFAGSVENVLKSYEIQNFLSGIDIFLEYGKDSKLKTFWNTLGSSDRDAELLFYGMDRVDEGVSLCNVDLIAYGINVIRDVINHPVTSQRERNIFLDIIINAIKSDYGNLLAGDEVSIPELLKWSFRKGLYQQTLTIIESRVPEDMVRRGIFYYARNEEDIENVMRELNILYWNDVNKMRWSYNQPDHYFVKYYGRFAIDYRQNKDQQAKDYARLRVDETLGKTDKVLRAYSDLNDDNLLFSILYNYYKIGNLRNMVNHAELDVNEKVSLDSIQYHKDSRDILGEIIGIFISLYSMACEKVPSGTDSKILTGQKLKSYVRSHELKILEEPKGDLTVQSSYSCQFSGKEVLININMLQNESAEKTED